MNIEWNATRQTLFLIVATMALGGCLESESTETFVPDNNSNQAPSISGVPAQTAVTGQEYVFMPTASDPDGDKLTFSVSNLPSWASFNTATGEITGMPMFGNEGDFTGISISVSDGDLSDTMPSFSINVSSVDGGNTAPRISGTPPTTAVVGVNYSFTPTASDADGNRLTFSISNMPNWATFDSSSGQLSGMPGDGNVGTYSGIIISVSDSDSSTSLPAFSIDVGQSANGSVTLTWTAPAENEDGTALTNLAGYKIYYGTQASVYTQSVRVDNPGLTTYVVQNLAPSTYYFAATAFNAQGVESAKSNETVKVVN